MAAILKKYVFNKTARTITFSDFPSILLQDIGEIVNVTRNIVIYDPLNGATGATSLVGNVLTLSFDTSAYENTDVLRIVYGDSFAQKITVGSGSGGGGGGGDASSSLQTAGNNTLTAINNKTPALGQALAGASIPVVLPSAQITTLTPPPAITNFALDSTVAKDGTDITTPTAMPTGGAGIRGWLSAIWTRINGVFTARSLSFTPTATITRAANTTAYVANDHYGGIFQLSGFGSASGSVFLTDVRIIFNIAALPVGMAGFQLYLFSITPPSARADNDAFSLPSGDRASCLTPNGIDLTARLATGGGSVIAVANNVNRKYLVPANTNIFGCLVTLAAFTPAAVSETASILCETVEA